MKCLSERWKINQMKKIESQKVFLRKKLKIKKLENEEIKIRKNYQKNEKDKITFYPI